MMKRLIKMLLILCVFYILIQLGFQYFGKGHTVNYEIKNSDYVIKIKETATFRQKNEQDNYYFVFETQNQKFYLQTYQLFKKNNRVIKDVKYFKNDNYECIYPIFQNHENVTDILCEHDNIIYHYQDLKNKSGELDKFAKDLTLEGYNPLLYVDNMDDAIKDDRGPIMIYPKNIVKNHYLGVDNYSGIYLINNYLDTKNLYRISIFSNDFYEKTLDASANKYYIVADYNATYEFSTFYVVDLVYNTQKQITYHSKISFDSYIMGTVDNAIYIFDRGRKKQYKIDVKAETIVEIGNEQTGIKYYQLGEWENRKVVEAINSNLYFNNHTLTPTNEYEKIDKVGGSLSGYYYYYKKVQNNYQVYRSNVQNEEMRTYLFTTSNIKEIKYLDDYIYYKEGNYIRYYHDMTGVRTIVNNSEFEFNKSLNYYIYFDK